MKRKNYELFILSILGVASIAVLILRIIFIYSYLPETGGVSINVLYGIKQLLTTGSLYINPEEPPFSIIQYMPLHYYIIGFLSKTINIQSNVHAIMMLNRFICLLYDLISVVVIIQFIKKTFAEVGNRIATSFGLFYFLLIPSIIFSRVDNLYLLLWILTICNTITFIKNQNLESKNHLKNIILIGIFSALALITKQTAVFLIAFLFCFLLFILRNRKAAFAYLVSAGSIFIVLLLIFGHSDPIAFKLNVVDGLKNGINLNWFLEVFMKNYFMKYTVLICIGIFTGTLLLQQKKSILHLFLGMGIIYNFIIAIIFSLKGGSGPNYYLEFNILSILGICLLLCDLPSISLNYFRFTAILIPVFLLSCMNDKGWGYLSSRKKALTEYQDCSSVATYVKSKLVKDNFVLTAFHKENSLNLLLTPYALFPCREVALYFTYPMGVFKFTKFKELLSIKRIQYYIDEKGIHPDTFLHEDISNFVADTTIGNYTIYKVNQ